MKRMDGIDFGTAMPLQPSLDEQRVWGEHWLSVAQMELPQYVVDAAACDLESIKLQFVSLVDNQNIVRQQVAHKFAEHRRMARWTVRSDFRLFGDAPRYPLAARSGPFMTEHCAFGKPKGVS